MSGYISNNKNSSNETKIIYIQKKKERKDILLNNKLHKHSHTFHTHRKISENI